jgi:hypothetical protein
MAQMKYKTLVTNSQISIIDILENKSKGYKEVELEPQVGDPGFSLSGVESAVTDTHE